MSASTTKINQQLPVRDTLFGDLPLSYWAGTDSDALPWSLFKEADVFDKDGEDAEAVAILQEIIAMPGLESRQYLQAFHFLRVMYGVKQAGSRLLGVVVEVAVEGGVDLLAVYADHSARYYNYTGAAIIMEPSNELIAGKIDQILTLGENIVPHIGPWTRARPDAPKAEFARINFLTTGGLHFGEAHQAVLFKDPMAGGIMYAMLDMMQTMITLTETK